MCIHKYNIIKDTNKALMSTGDIGGILEGFSGQISNLILIFSMIITLVLSVFSYLVYNEKKIIDKNLDETKKYVDEIYIKLKDEIESEIYKQILSNFRKLISEIEDSTYRKIDNNLEEVSNIAYNKLFDYQHLIFQINQAKKYSLEKILNNQSFTIEEKLNRSAQVEGSYNEISNHDIPNLFSNEIEDKLIPAAKKLSVNKELQPIIVKHLKSVISKNYISYTQKSKIKDMLEEYYNYREDI